MHHDSGAANHIITVMFVTWGQLLDHDLTLTAETKGKLELTNTFQQKKTCGLIKKGGTLLLTRHAFTVKDLNARPMKRKQFNGGDFNACKKA